MIDLAILGLLSEQELHGYELRKRLASLVGGRATVSFGSIYPALAPRLERASCVKAVESRTSPAPIAPMSGSLAGELAALRARVRSGVNTRGHGGRSRKVYGITPAGRERLRELLTDQEVADDRTFAVKVALCALLSSAERLELFERRRSELLRRADEHRAAGAARSDSYLRSLREHDQETLKSDLAWMERLIEAERANLETEAPAGGNQ